MSFFRSPLLRRIIYAIAFALALTRFASRSHAEEMLANSGPELAAISETML